MISLSLSAKNLAVITIVILVAAVVFLTSKSTNHPKNFFSYGVSFSPSYATHLGLDWKQTYLSMLTDLKVNYLRLPSYFSEIEPFQNQTNFEDLDFMLDQAKVHNLKVLLVVGSKQPRWPECHLPDWVKNQPQSVRQELILEFIQKVVLKYKQNPTIWGWQVENEPLFDFGSSCDKPDFNFLKKEVALVRKLDPKRKVVVTETGEWRLWNEAMSVSDILGISLYHKSYNPILGYINYPFPSSIYILKSDLTRKIFALQNQKTIITELQAEPWLKDSVTQTSLEFQIQAFTPLDFKNNLEFAQKTGFDEIYLWGVEWWYFMAKFNHPEYLKLAQNLLN
ncbi:cellulase family glycosylhydrolase [Candidatus Daviesbacteria bacterium]|nr:cellulase family glycosylhydrolase [Candidatus Daviesbacteria bacterium]